jgi:hypothetical protein
MNKRAKIIERMGVEKVFLINESRDLVMKSVPGTKLDFYFKNKHREEYLVNIYLDLVIETLMKAREITEKEYEEFGNLNIQ